MSAEPRRRRNRLLRFLFARSANRVDAISVAVNSVMLWEGHWLIAAAGLIVGACLSVAGVERLNRSEMW